MVFVVHWLLSNLKNICYYSHMKEIILQHTPLLDRLAQRYVWWNPIDWAYAHPAIFLASAMDLGNWDDIQALRHDVGDEVLKTVLLHATAGYFHARSWDYWHIKFGINPIPSLPKREL